MDYFQSGKLNFAINENTFKYFTYKYTFLANDDNNNSLNNTLDFITNCNVSVTIKTLKCINTVLCNDLDMLEGRGERQFVANLCVYIELLLRLKPLYCNLSGYSSATLHISVIFLEILKRV